MTTPLPPWRVISRGPTTSEVEVDLPDFRKMILVIGNDHVGTPTMDASLRVALARHESTVDVTSTGAPL